MKKLILNALVILLLLFSCKKEEQDQSVSDPCAPVPLPPSWFGWKLHYNYKYSQPDFNPENSDEIAFFEQGNGEFWLCKYNLSNKQKTYILEGGFWSGPQFGLDNWILFTRNGANIYKIKSDGTQLTRLTSNGNCFKPMWSHDYQKIYCYSNVTIDETPNKPGGKRQISVGIEMDTDGNVLDTINVFFGPNYTIINDSILAYSVSTGLRKLNLNTKISELIAIIDTSNNGKESPGPPTEVVKINDSEVFWTRIGGVYVTNIHTGLTRQLKASCSSDFYSVYAYSDKKNKVLLTNMTKTPDGDILILRKKVILMNPDGSGEEVLKIPD